MPRKSAVLSLADENAAVGGVGAVDRALSLLNAFSASLPQPDLTELAQHTRLHKSTVLRLMASLEHAHLVQRQADGRYALGPGIARLHQVYASSFSLASVVMPILRQLAAATQESAALHVRQGDQRLCLQRVDSPRPVRDHTRVGDLLPLNRGAGGRILSAYAGGTEDIHARIRREQVVVLVGDRLPELAGIAAPAFGAGGEFVGSITLTMPAERFDVAYQAPVKLAARALTEALGGAYPAPEPSA